MDKFAVEFLEKRVAEWPMTSPEKLAGLAPEHRALIEHLENVTKQQEPIQIAYAIERMKFPSHLAVQYVLFKDDFEKTLAQMRQTPGTHPKAVHDLLCESFERSMKYKLRILAHWYAIMHADRPDKIDLSNLSQQIERHGRNAQKGCARQSTAAVILLGIALYWAAHHLGIA